MNAKQLAEKATNKTQFKTLQNYIDFCKEYLDYVQSELQAVIVSQNENHYCFYQYNESGSFQITRPINSNLMINCASFNKIEVDFIKILKNVKGIDDFETRNIINHTVYTLQQSIGAALDALPQGKSNTARKLNGDLFENLIRLIIQKIGFPCRSGVISIPIIVDGKKEFSMNYQHDLILGEDDRIALLGSVKTSSKDRLDKIFIDKYLYNKLTETNIPHIAIFLNDVQRKNTKKENEYGINSTFLPGHFKGYTVKLNPLDGVYYCDIRPNMLMENLLKEHIGTFDQFICKDIWEFYNQ